MAEQKKKKKRKIADKMKTTRIIQLASDEPDEDINEEKK